MTYTCEKQCSQPGIQNMQNLIPDDDAEEANKDQDNPTDEEHTIAGSEVIFGLWEE